MPHAINTDDITEDVFILQNLCFASKTFCKTYKIGGYTEDETEFELDYYKGWLEYLVSDKLINCAIKIRILHDILKTQDEESEFSDIDKICCDGLIFGQYHSKPELLTIREACNKIIHATEVTLVWKDIPSEKMRQSTENMLEYWNGNIILEGSKSSTIWKLELFVPEFCTALFRLNSALEDKIDWLRI